MRRDCHPQVFVRQIGHTEKVIQLLLPMYYGFGHSAQGMIMLRFSFVSDTMKNSTSGESTEPLPVFGLVMDLIKVHFPALKDVTHSHKMLSFLND